MRLTRVALGTVALGFVMSALAPPLLHARGRAADNPAPLDTADSPEVKVVGSQSGPVQLWREPEGSVLYNNGPLITNAGVCAAGASASRLQTSIGMNILGFNGSIAAATRIADDFTVPAGGSWIINQMTFFGYQTGSTTTSTFNAVRVQIWNGPPNVPGSTIVFGDLTTNRLASSAFSSTFRDTETATCPAASTRPIMAIIANVGVTLGPGTYWVDYQLGGTLASGPFVPPITLLAPNTDGCPGAALCNGLNFTGGVWVALAEQPIVTAVQDAPFIIEGQQGTPTINIGDATVTEGNAGSVNALLPVTLTSSSATPVTVNFATADGTATAGSDYTSTTGTLTFAPGTTSLNVTVSVTGDLTVEADETFFVNLTAPVGANPGDVQGLGTITNDDVPTISVGDASVVEGNSGPVILTAPVTLSEAAFTPVTVAFATADNTATAGPDYTATSGVLTFAPGTTALGVTVSVIGDVLDESDETFFVNLTAPTNATIADGQGLETIIDDDGGADTTGELNQGFKVTGDLASAGGTPDTDTYVISQNPYSSYEVVVDAASGDISPANLERVDTVTSTVVQSSQAVGTGTGRSLRWANDTTNTIVTDTVRVTSGGCQTDCGVEDTYRLRAYETTNAIPRFNNSASQVTVLLLQNPTDYLISANVYFWDPAGTRLHTEPVVLGPKGVFVLNTSTIPAVNGVSGAITVTHNGRFGDLAGKSVAVEPATGFSFDSPMLTRSR